MAQVYSGSNFVLLIDDEINALDDAIADLADYCKEPIAMAPSPDRLFRDCGFAIYREPVVKDWEQRRYRRQGKPRRKR